MATIKVITKPVHCGRMMNIGRSVHIEANGHAYKLWHDIREYEELEKEARQLAADIGAEYIQEPNWSATPSV